MAQVYIAGVIAFSLGWFCCAFWTEEKRQQEQRDREVAQDAAREKDLALQRVAHIEPSR